MCGQCDHYGLLVRAFLELQEHDGHNELKQDIRDALFVAAINSEQPKHKEG
jgi:hypothetical protein